MSQTIRDPAVAGQFYDADPQRLKAQIEACIDFNVKKRSCIGAVSPHAGYMYSGPVAGSLYSHVSIPGTVILVGPNHTGFGDRISIMSSGRWSMPFGEMLINEELASRIIDKTDIVADNASAHLFEHSLEVQLPFIQYFRNDASIVPILCMTVSIEDCRELGRAVAGAIKDYDGEVLIVASSDMSHYVPHEIARKKDRLAIDRVLDLDPEGLYDVIKMHNISMCGYIPATVMLFAAKELGAVKTELIKYSTSGETSGDYDRVVGYAGIIVI